MFASRDLNFIVPNLIETHHAWIVQSRANLYFSLLDDEEDKKVRRISYLQATKDERMEAEEK